MPFLMGEGDKALPEELRHYWPLVKACVEGKHRTEWKGLTFYLTIMETSADEARGDPQRRGGLHTEGFLAEHPFGALHTDRRAFLTGLEEDPGNPAIPPRGTGWLKTLVPP